MTQSGSHPRPAVPGSPMLLARWRSRWTYAWNNSSRPSLRAARRLSDVLGDLRAEVTVSSAGHGPTLAYAGLPDGLVHVLPYLEQCRARLGGGTSVHDVRRASRKTPDRDPATSDADVLVVGCTARRARSLPTERSVLLPMRCHLVVDTSPGARQVIAEVSRKARQQFTRERVRRDWRLEVADGEADFEDFYDRMHVPTMYVRHGTFTRSLPRQIALTSVYRHGVLFFLTERGERIAGMLCRLDADGRRLTLRLAGIRGGESDLYRTGASMAIYLLILEWAADRGIASVDLSGFEPFLSKGIFQFKRKMHPQVVLPDNHFRTKRLWLHVRHDTAAVRDLLVANPPLSVGADGALTAVYFHDAERPPRTDLQWRTAGVTAVRHVDLDAFLASPAGSGGTDVGRHRPERDGWPGIRRADDVRSPRAT